MIDNNPHPSIETTLQRFSNDETTDEVFEREHHSTKPELADALAATPHVTDKEARAFVFGHIHNFPPVADEVAEAQNMVNTLGFESLSEFTAAKETAAEKIGEAVWIYELLEAYRFPPIPEDCAECGRSLRGTWVENEDGDALCRDCGDATDLEFVR